PLRAFPAGLQRQVRQGGARHQRPGARPDAFLPLAGERSRAEPRHRASRAVEPRSHTGRRAPGTDETRGWRAAATRPPGGRCRTTPGWLDRRACLRSGPIRLRDTGLWGPTPVRLDLARRLHGVSRRVVDHHRFRRRSHMKWTKPEFEVVELGMEVGAYAGTA